MTKHEWRDREEDGELRFFRASKHGANWRLQSRLKSEDTWTTLDPIPMDNLVQLRDLLWRKYQRKRARFEDVCQIDELIASS